MDGSSPKDVTERDELTPELGVEVRQSLLLLAMCLLVTAAVTVSGQFLLALV